MSQKQTAGLPDLPDLDGQWKIQFSAADPTTGADVAGVKISAVGLLVTDVAGGTPELVQVEPLWIPLPSVAPGG